MTILVEGNILLDFWRDISRMTVIQMHDFLTFTSFWGLKGRDLPMILTSDEVTSENKWQILIRHRMYYFISYVLFYVPNTHFRYKQPSTAHFTIATKGGLFQVSFCIHHDLWRHAIGRYLHCDLIFVDCFCTRKLAQKRSSLVNNNHEYRFFRLSMYKIRFIIWISK